MADLKSIDEVIEEHREADPQFQKRWDKASCARAVAATIIGYRAENDLPQTQLAREVGTTQSVIGRLELGEHPPSLATLAKLTARTGLEFHLDITGGDVAMSA